MTAPDRAVAGLRRCLEARDYAGAARLIEQPATFDGLTTMSVYAAGQRADADRARAEAAAARLAEAERARVQAVIGPLLNEVIGVLAAALGVPQEARHRTCPYCGNGTRSAGWPASRDAAA